MMDAELSVLGGVLIDPQAFWRVSDIVRAEQFSRADSRLLWTTVEGMIRRGEASDAVTVGEVNPALSDLALQCASDVFSTANIRAYADIVADRWLAREVQKSGSTIAAIEGKGKERLAEAQAIIGRLVSGIAGQSKPIKEVMAERVATMQAQCDRSGKLMGVTTGLPKLDTMTAGWQPGQLVILAGRPSMGKTLLGLQFATVAAMHEAPAHIVTLEMSASDCFARQQSWLSRIPFDRVRDARAMLEEDWPRMVGACDELSKLPIMFDDACYDLAQIVARIRQAHAQQGTKLVLVDYLTYIRMPKADSASLAVQEITRELKMTAKALGITIILISQLNRSVEARSDKRPLMSDLRESGAIEQDADIVLMPYRDEYYNPESPHKGFAELLVRKQRNGITGMVPLYSRLDIQRFEEAEELPDVSTESTSGVVHFGRNAGRKRS